MEEIDPLAGKKALVAARTALIKSAELSPEVVDIFSVVSKTLHSKTADIDAALIERVTCALKSCPPTREVQQALLQLHKQGH